MNRPEVKFDGNGIPYIWITKSVHGKDIKVKIYGEQGERPKHYVK